MKTLRSPASGTFVVAGTLVNSTAFHFRTYTGPSCASAGIVVYVGAGPSTSRNSGA